MSAALEGRGEVDELVDLMLNVWLGTLVEGFQPLITWLNDDKPRKKEKEKEALHE